MDEHRIKILLVDDDEEDYIITRDILSEIEDWLFDVKWVAKYEAALESIETSQFDVCLVDYHLGGRNGLELLSEVIGNGCKIPMILLTGQSDREVDIQAMVAGAADYLVKGRIDSFLLERSIRYSIQRRQEQEAKATLEEQLFQFQKMESIGRLAGGVAHELNNLLTPIVGYTQLLLTQPTTGDHQRGNLEQIDRAATRASNLVQQLLTFSHRQNIEPQVLQLNDVIADVGKMLRHLIDEDIELVLLPGQEVKLVRADPSQLEQVLINLTVNARDAMPDGGKITIETTNVIKERDRGEGHQETTVGEYTVLTVSDNGIGMAEEVKDHIFEPFFTTKEQGKGTGLGLATCYGIVTQIDGYIDVYSKLGQGTSIKIYLPTVTGDISKPDQPESYNDIPPGSETILLVEDEPLVRSLIVTILQDQGYTVLEATNGEEALRVAHQHSGKEIHLLMTDIIMPRMGGVELSEKFGTLYPDARVLLMSGYNDEMALKDGSLDESIGFIPKPFTPATLARKAREVLDQR